MRTLITALAGALALAIAAAPAADGAGRTVRVTDYRFTPRTLAVSAGTTVTWRWKGKDPHNVTGKGFKSKTMSSGTYSHRFTRAGTFKYVCTIHAKSFGMHGKVVVG
jgi:plastocyanin